MNLSFKASFPWDKTKETFFESKINAGKKIHTIREDKRNRWFKGAQIHFCTNIRTRQYNCFKISRCSGTQKIKIMRTCWGGSVDLIDVFIDERRLAGWEIFEMSKNDGFDNIEDFKKWFSEDFEGKIIHWTDKRY